MKIINRIITISLDQSQNPQVDFDNLEEIIHGFLAALGIECVVSGEDEEIVEDLSRGGIVHMSRGGVVPREVLDG